MRRRTKIVATLGPASLHPDTFAAMVRAGVDVVRLNTSHGTLEEHARTIEMVRKVAGEQSKPVAVMLDLAGPKLRTGPVPGDQPIELVTGAEVTVTNRIEASSPGVIAMDYPRLTEDVRAGDRVLIDDGKIELEVSHVSPDGLACRVVFGGPVGAHKGVSFPQSDLTMPALTDRDREAIRCGVGANVDLFALSFVSDARDVVMTRSYIQSLGAEVPIIAKIERRQAVDHLDAILGEADGAMVARGDLGVELAPEDVPVQQRRIIASASRNMIPVITATQMLESMVQSPRPTRAESSDVANAVWDRSDALMLSEETAVGRYPVESVAMMDRIIRAAEQESTPEELANYTPDTDDHSYVVALAARRIVESDPNMHGIVCFTRSGYTGWLLSKVHPNAPIFAVSNNEPVYRRLSLARGVVPVLGPFVESSEQMLHLVDRVLVEQEHVAEGEEVVVVASLPVQASGTTNFLKLHRVGESARY